MKKLYTLLSLCFTFLIAQDLNVLQAQKVKAVENENYAEAQRLQEEINTLSFETNILNGTLLKNYTDSIQLAIAKEDFNKASDFKEKKEFILSYQTLENEKKEAAKNSDYSKAAEIQKQQERILLLLQSKKIVVEPNDIVSSASNTSDNPEDYVLVKFSGRYGYLFIENFYIGVLRLGANDWNREFYIRIKKGTYNLQNNINPQHYKKNISSLKWTIDLKEDTEFIIDVPFKARLRKKIDLSRALTQIKLDHEPDAKKHIKVFDGKQITNYQSPKTFFLDPIYDYVTFYTNPRAYSNNTSNATIINFAVEGASLMEKVPGLYIGAGTEYTIVTVNNYGYKSSNMNIALTGSAQFRPFAGRYFSTYAFMDMGVAYNTFSSETSVAVPTSTGYISGYKPVYASSTTFSFVSRFGVGGCAYFGKARTFGIQSDIYFNHRLGWGGKIGFVIGITANSKYRHWLFNQK